MPRILLNRIGADTLAKLEAAATRRYAEARRLQAAEPLGALYLYGYTVEMRLKAAYYRLTLIPPNWNLLQRIATNPDSPRDIAENQIRALLGMAHRAAVGHNLTGWVRLLIDVRSAHPLGPFDGPFEQELGDHVQAAARQWREILRYRANRPYDTELNDVIAAARWVRTNYRRLWS